LVLGLDESSGTASRLHLCVSGCLADTGSRTAEHSVHETTNIAVSPTERVIYFALFSALGGSVAEWLACWTQAQKGPGSNRCRDAVG